MRQWKVGAITGGVLLIAIGALWLLQSFLPIPFAKVLLYSWPIICILLGVEILVLHFQRKEQQLKVHWLCIFLLIFIGGVSLLFNMGQLALNELGFSFQSASYELNETLSPTSAIDEVIVTVPDYSVTVTGTDEQTVNIAGLVQANVKSGELLEEQLNNSFSIRQVSDKVYIELQRSSDFTNASGTLHITVPKNADVRVTASHGNVDVNNINGSAALQADNGNINANQFTGSMIAQSYGGNIRIQNSSLTSNSVIETSGGNIILNLKQDDSISLNATAQYGEIQGNIDWEITSSKNEDNEDGEERKQGTAQVGDGATSLILTTNSGNIIVNQ